MLFVDRTQISSKRVFSDEGFLTVPAKISRVGTQEYKAFELGLTDRDPGSVVIVYRPPDEVFNEESIASFKNKPVTDDHPTEAVTSKNAKMLTVGHSMCEVTHDEEFVTTMLMITDETAIEKIRGGKSELSNGYAADIELSKGISPDGIKYDAIQRNIRGNHIAIVERGRAGSEVRLSDQETPNKDENMKTVIIDGISYEMSEQVADVVKKLQQRVSDAEHLEKEAEDKLSEAEDQAKEEKDKKDKELQEAKDQAEEAKKKAPTEDAIAKMVSDRAELIGQVAILDSSIVIDKQTNDELKKEVVASAHPDLDLKDRSSDYIQSRFDAMVSDHDGNSQATLDNAFKDVAKVNKGSEVKDNRSETEISRDKMMKDSQNAWKPKAKKGDE